jgi:molecular chaperone GrpE
MENQAPESDKKNSETETNNVGQSNVDVSEQLKKELEDFKQKYFYLAADMDNLRKRTEREKSNLVKFGNESILQDLIEVVDNFDRTIEMLRFEKDEKVKNIMQGLDMVKKQFLDVLNKNGLSLVDSIGKDFDPNFHEALAQEYAEGKKPNEVIKEFQKGYVLNGRLIRAAKVVIASDKQ